MVDRIGGSLEQLDALAAELRRQSTAAAQLRALLDSEAAPLAGIVTFVSGSV